MKRENKFRLWANNLKVLYTPEMDDEMKNLWHIGMLVGGRMKIDNGDEVMQYIGLKDKNGKEIYEGDIDKESGFFIKWNQLHCCFALFSPLGMQHEIIADWADRCGNAPKKWMCSDLEIIGNIYENPELLNRK